MDFETIAKIVATLVGIVSVGRALYEIVSGAKSKLREEYRFAREFLDDLSSEKGLHPFALEKGYQAIAGTAAISGEEVAYILSLENSVRGLRDFVLSKKYLEHLRTGNLQIVFKKKYEKQWARSWRKWAYLAAYGVFAFLTMLPLLLAAPLHWQPRTAFTLVAFTLPVCGHIAWDSIRSFAKIYRGEKLVERQTKHGKASMVLRPLA